MAGSIAGSGNWLIAASGQQLLRAAAPAQKATPPYTVVGCVKSPPCHHHVHTSMQGMLVAAVSRSTSISVAVPCQYRTGMCDAC